MFATVQSEHERVVDNEQVFVMTMNRFLVTIDRIWQYLIIYKAVLEAINVI